MIEMFKRYFKAVLFTRLLIGHRIPQNYSLFRLQGLVTLEKKKALEDGL